MSITVDQVLEFYQPTHMTEERARLTAGHALSTAIGLVGNYCRDRHVTPTGEYRPGVEAVILSVAARILANPGQVAMSDSAGALTVNRGKGLQGFTLGEQMTLNRYRKRAI